MSKTDSEQRMFVDYPLAEHQHKLDEFIEYVRNMDNGILLQRMQNCYLQSDRLFERMDMEAAHKVAEEHSILASEVMRRMEHPNE